ncbi:DUF3139 domain-containing protein [Staphylococcus equorum]|uniref:DUF3139 domain-containing protein n=2 Tax=Staphylococcus equorum TaxID=246432 RepID=UPI0025550BDC|nr:DUF3139 domain-containing protein [Staphylococcus equorum]MDK9847728.1 DUF3139 domain-containing protein [Staphylococcus equorum]
MKKKKKFFLIILSLLILIIVGIIIGVTVHKNNVEKEKKEDYKIINKKIKAKGWEKNIKSKKETYNSKMGQPEIQIVYKDNPKITYEYTIINKNEVLGAATTNSDRGLKKSDEKYEIE